MKFLLMISFLCLFAFVGCQAVSESSSKNESTSPTLGEDGVSGVSNETKSEPVSESKEVTAPDNPDKEPDKKETSENAGKIETIYTDLDEKKCKTIKSSEEEEWIIQECPGVAGYKLEVIEGDLRQSINVIAPSGGKYQLDFQSNVSMAFSYLGKKAEWRVKRQGGKIIPVGLITRFNASEDPEDSKKITSYLVVTKFDGEFICVTDVVKPIRNANVKARQLADVAPTKPCLKGNR